MTDKKTGNVELPDNGLIILDKPYGHVAHEITTYVKKLLGVKRSGHAGTLDPDVSGVMPIAIGKATKLLGYIAGRRKTYVCIMKIKDRSVSDTTLKQLFKEFTGELTQTPPKKSAVRKVPRKRIVYYIKFLERKDNLVLFEAEVDAGTYIRTLCEDMGKKIGGARMDELRRIAVGKITEQQAVKLQDLIDAVWLYKHDKPQQLESMIKKRVDPSLVKFVFSETQDRGELLKQLDEKKILCIIATTVFGEGINVKRLETLVYAKASDSSIDTIQVVGRALRRGQGKFKAVIFDFIDKSKYLMKRSKHRRELLEQEPEFVVKTYKLKPEKVLA